MTKRAFTIIEIMVVLLIIGILMAIVTAVGSQVMQQSERSVTKTELLNLSAALEQLQHKGFAITPSTTMAEFLSMYQQQHAFISKVFSGGSWTGSYQWMEHPNIISELPAPELVKGAIAMPITPNCNASMPGVVAVDDAFGNPIILVTTEPRAPYFVSAGPSGIIGNADNIFSYAP